tara:strand:- start:58 stop:384 length:327 start_codon:yes stop_codon:yes gene_type:complete
MKPTLLNKLILIVVIFLIGISIIDGFIILTPKIIEGNTNEAIKNREHTNHIKSLKDRLRINVPKVENKIKRSTMLLVDTLSKYIENLIMIPKVTKAVKAKGDAVKLEP